MGLLVKLYLLILFPRVEATLNHACKVLSLKMRCEQILAHHILLICKEILPSLEVMGKGIQSLYLLAL